MTSINQTPWTVANVIGHSRDPYTKQIDLTEGFGAFDSILNAHSLGTRTIDIGGGQHDFNSAYLDHIYDIEHRVYDPFMRPDEHNAHLLAKAIERPFDSCTSISVLNVIDQEDARLEHIKLCYAVVKECGKVFFKVWPGNGTGMPEKKKGSFQSNKNMEAYVKEIENVFGRNVSVDHQNKLIKCVKMLP